ncbi:unnamed protein product, partial [Lampetra planeri]
MATASTTTRRSARRRGREAHERARKAKKLIGLKAKLYNKERHKEKIQIKKTIKMHEQRMAKQKDEDKTPKGRGARLSPGPRGPVQGQSSVQHDQAEAQGEGGQVGRPAAQGAAPRGRRRCSAWSADRQDAAQVVEAPRHQGLLRGRRLHPQAAQVRALHPPHGIALQEGPRDPPRVEGHFCLPILGVKKNPSSPMYTSLGVITKGNRHRGERQRAGPGDAGRQGGVGKVRAGNEQPGERRLHQRCSARV